MKIRRKKNNKKKAMYHYNVILRQEPEGGFTVIVPAFPGCVTYGRTLKEAKLMAKDAVIGYIASMMKHKETIPSDNDTVLASLDFEYAKVA